MSSRNAGPAIVTCALLIFLPVLMGCGGGIEFDDFDWSLPGRIVFDSDRDGNDEIYIMKTDGKGLNNLTNNPESDVTAVISPDGSKIAFASNRHNGIHYEIYVMSSTGGAVTRLTHFENSVSSFPSFSPDGSKIVFEEGRDVHIMSSTGGAVTNLTNNAKGNSYPSFSPDGSKILFSSNRGGSQDIYTMNLNGDSVERLTNDSGDNMMPAFSPDGSKIAFSRGEDLAWDGMFVMNSDGTGRERLTSGMDAHPCFSSDGLKITFTRFAADESAEIYIMWASGFGTPKRLTNSPSGTRALRPFYGSISP